MFVRLASCVVCVFCVSAKKCPKENIGGVENVDLKPRGDTTRVEGRPKPVFKNEPGNRVKFVVKPKSSEPLSVMKLVVKTKNADTVRVTFSYPDGPPKTEVSVRRLCGPLKGYAVEKTSEWLSGQRRLER